jgi:hypothetical protein
MKTVGFSRNEGRFWQDLDEGEKKVEIFYPGPGHQEADRAKLNWFLDPTSLFLNRCEDQKIFLKIKACWGIEKIIWSFLKWPCNIITIKISRALSDRPKTQPFTTNKQKTSNFVIPIN